jgi:hypothetical protein
MKTLILTTLLSAGAFAAQESTLLLSKANYPGFVRGEAVRIEKCDIYMDKVVITRTYGADEESTFTASEERKLTLTEGVTKAIEKAATEKMEEKPNGLCDGPGTDIIAHKGAEEVVLFDTGGCGSPGKDRKGGATWMLRDLIDLYCPKTHATPNNG